MDTITSKEPISKVKEMLIEHIDWLSNLWHDLAMFQELAAQHPNVDFSDNQHTLIEAIEREQYIITRIKRGNYEGC